jgi:hypothetical protein
MFGWRRTLTSSLAARRLRNASSGFEFRHLLAHSRGRDAVKKRLHQPREIALRLAQRVGIRRSLRNVLCVQAVHGASVFLAKNPGSGGLHQTVLEAVEHGVFQCIAPDCRLVVAGAFVAGVRAADIDLVEMHDPAAADGALHQAGKQIARAAALPVSGRSPERGQLEAP